MGKQSSDCLCSPAEICSHFEEVGKPSDDPDFCIEHLREAEEWLNAEASRDGSDLRNAEFSDDLRFSVSEVNDGFNDLKNCAFGLDGVSKTIFDPILIVIAPTVASFFAALLCYSVSPSDWQIAVLCLINNFRAVHLLSFFYK